MVKNVIDEESIVDFSKMNIGDSSLMPLNILENEYLPKGKKKEIEARAHRLKQEKRQKETDLLEQICNRLEQKTKFVKMANEDNLTNNDSSTAMNSQFKNRKIKNQSLKA